MTLMAETHARMMQSLRGMAFFDLRLVPSALQYVSGYKILIDEGEEGVSKVLYTEMKAKEASLFILDGLFAVEEVCESRAAYRAFVHGLQAYAGATGCTMLLLTNAGPGPPGLHHAAAAQRRPRQGRHPRAHAGRRLDRAHPPHRRHADGPHRPG